MSVTLDTPHERLAWARQRAGLSKADFARGVGVHPTTYRAYESGQNGFAKLAAMFAKRLGVTAEWLLEGGPLPEGHFPTPTPDIPPTRSAFRDDETVEIAQIDLSFAMGPGREIDDYIEQEPVKFDLGFVRSITRTPPSRLRLARGVGDSMFPTLQNNDRVMIDTTQRTLNLSDRVWAVSLYGAAAIKRLRTIGPNRVLVISDNVAVPDQEVDAEDLMIAGRVIWFARDL